MSKNVKPDRKLSPKQLKAIAALLEGHTKQDAATAAGVTPKTLSRWLHEDALFFESLQNGKDKIVTGAAVQLLGSLDLAGQTLRDLIQSGANESIKLRAANAVIANAIKLYEVSDLAQRLAIMEDSLAAVLSDHAHS